MSGRARGRAKPGERRKQKLPTQISPRRQSAAAWPTRVRALHLESAQAPAVRTAWSHAHTRARSAVKEENFFSSPCATRRRRLAICSVGHFPARPWRGCIKSAAGGASAKIPPVAEVSQYLHTDDDILRLQPCSTMSNSIRVHDIDSFYTPDVGSTRRTLTCTPTQRRRLRLGRPPIQCESF